jgi:hypothetical protein
MKFRVVLSNHSPESINKLEDMACWLWRGLEEAGHVACVSVGHLDPGAINIFFEYFPDRTLPVFDRLAQMRIPFGILCSEAVTGDTLNDYDSPDDMIVPSEGFTWKRRFENFRTVAGQAEFVWCVHAPSADRAKAFTRGGRSIFLQSGYVDARREAKPSPPEHKDIDVLFFGATTPYRQRILDQLRAAGLKVEAPDYYVPTFARTSLIERSRICLSLNMRENWPIPSVSRISYLINNGALVVWEKPPFETGHEPFSLAVPTDAVADVCTGIIRNYNPKLGERFAADFRKALPMAPIMRQAVADTCAHLS